MEETPAAVTPQRLQVTVAHEELRVIARRVLALPVTAEDRTVLRATVAEAAVVLQAAEAAIPAVEVGVAVIPTLVAAATRAGDVVRTTPSLSRLVPLAS
jgi:hypothetical protein